MLKHNITLVNIHFPGHEVLFWALLKRLWLFHGTIVLSFHGGDTTQIRLERSPYQRLLWRLILADVTALTACSRQLSDKLKELFPWASTKVHVVPNGVDVSAIAAESRSHRDLLGNGMTFYLISIAGFEPEKGLDVLLAAFAPLRVQWPALRLLLLCRAGPNRQAIDALIQQLAIADWVSIEVDCPHDRAMSLLTGAEALVVPSRKEAFGIVVLEAAALGKPVILTDVCGVLEWLDGSLVTIVPPADAVALGRAIARVLSHKQIADTQAQRLKIAASETLSWSHAATLLLTAAGEVAGAAPSAGMAAQTDNASQHRTADARRPTAD